MMPQEPTYNRTENGKFGPGNNANPAGRPRSIVKYRQIVISECDEEAWTAIVRKAVEQALDGWPAARTFLARYVCPHEQIVRIEGEAGDAMRALIEKLSPTVREKTLCVLRDIDRERRAS